MVIFVASKTLKKNTVERQRSSLSKIITLYEHEANYTKDKKPAFYSDSSQFTVTLMNLNYKMSDKMSDKVLNKQQLIYEYILKSEIASVSEVSENLNIPVSTTRRILKNMTEQDIIAFKGAKKNRKYTIK